MPTGWFVTPPVETRPPVTGWWLDSHVRQGAALAVTVGGSAGLRKGLRSGATLTESAVLSAGARKGLRAGASLAESAVVSAGGHGPLPLSGGASLTVTAAPTSNGKKGLRSGASLTVTDTPSAGGSVFVPAPAFDAVGAGTHGTGTSLTWSHTLGASAKCAIVGLNCATTSTTPTITAKVGSTSMTELPRFQYTTSGGDCAVIIFYLLNPPTGAQTITVTVPSGSVTCGDSVSYTNVSSVGSTTTNSGSGTTASLSVPSSSGQLVVQVFGYNGAAGTTFASYNQTSRYLQAGVSSNCYPGMIGDAPGASTVSFSATITSAAWGGIGVPLSP